MRVPHVLCVCMPAHAYVALFCMCSSLQKSFGARYSGPVEACQRVTQMTKLSFTWLCVAEGLNETCEVQLTCQHAIQRGVHLPKAWKSRWRPGGEVLPTDAWAHDAVQRVRGEFALTDDVKIDCRLGCFFFMRACTFACTCP